MADDNNKKPEESFKDKIMQSLNGGTDSNNSADNGGAKTDEERARETRFSRRIFDDATPLGMDEPIAPRNETNEPTQSTNVESNDTNPVDSNLENTPTTPEAGTPSWRESNDFSDTTEEPLPPVNEQSTPSLEDIDYSSVGSRSQDNHETKNEEPEPTLEEIAELPPRQRKFETRKKERKVVRRIVLIVVATLVVLGTILGVTFYNFVQGALQPRDAEDSQLVQVNIPSGSSNKEIGEILENDNVIVSGLVFNYWTKFNNVDGFQSGYYQMSPDMTLDEISTLLQAGGTAEPQAIADAKIVIPEGNDITSIADIIETSTEGAITADDFLALMNDDAYFQKVLALYPQMLTSASEAEGVRYRLEGYLFPATYDYYADTTTAEGLADQMVAAMYDTLSPYFESIQNQGYTVQQFLTLASLVEREGVTAEDRANIAQVFINRINAGMALQSDISILYALGVHKEVVTYDDLEVDSPYNLYTNTGYGPGPFDSPGLASIEATLNPTPNDYYYFVADVDTGDVYFAETYEEHQQLVEEYVNN